MTVPSLTVLGQFENNFRQNSQCVLHLTCLTFNYTTVTLLYKVKEIFGEALDNTFSAMDTYWGPPGERDIILITTIQQYNDNNDSKSVYNVIDFLNTANVTITIQINLGADPNYGNEVKSLLADLVQMCNDIQTMVDY